MIISHGGGERKKNSKWWYVAFRRSSSSGFVLLTFSWWWPFDDIGDKEMLIKLVCNGWNRLCLIFDPIRFPSPGGKDNKSNAWRDCHGIVSPASSNSKQCGRRLLAFPSCRWTGLSDITAPSIKKESSNDSQWSVTSVLPKITQFSYKTFKCNELLKPSRCSKCNTLAEEDKLAFEGMYTPAPNRFFFCVHSMEVGSSRTQISLWGNGKMAETHAGATPIFATRHRRRKLWHGQWGKCHIFCAAIPLYLQIDALSEIVRRRRNECAPVTQRHTTGTSGGSPLGSRWLALKAQKAVYVIQM